MINIFRLQSNLLVDCSKLVSSVDGSDKSNFIIESHNPTGHSNG